jgi:hypothetical protein
LVENAKPIEPIGQYETRAGTIAPFSGAQQLTSFLANSEQVQSAFAQKLFHYMVKQPVRAYGLDTPTRLQQKFANSGYNIRKLLVEIAVIASRPAALN